MNIIISLAVIFIGFMWNAISFAGNCDCPKANTLIKKSSIRADKHLSILDQKTVSRGKKSRQVVRPITNSIVDNASVTAECGPSPIKFKHGKYVIGKSYMDRFVAEIVYKAFGDLNGDNVNDAAMIVSVNGGGSATYFYLYAMIGTSGKPRITREIFLGDRAEINLIKIKSKKIIINIVAHSENDGLCCPSVKKTLIYRFKNGKLVEKNRWVPIK